ncbi:MAG: hypothetical protein PHC53_02435 [Patescibacteria group bacterium]|nr:hypothetical protein [Patescibacteria group bacterium]
MSFKIKVAWRIENGEAKGRVIEDEKGRRKIVFVSRNFRGQFPKDGEITDAIIEKDTKPDEPGKGALLVSPRYAPNPNDLSKEDAHAKLVELARAALPVFDTGYVDVDLPGWQGDLMIKIPKWLNEGPLSATWSFHAKNGQILFGTLEMTTGVRFVRRQGLVVTNLAQAIKDLGEPTRADVTSLRYGHITWKDSHGGRLQATSAFENALAMDPEIRNIRLENGLVMADLALLKGKAVLEGELLTEREQFISDTGHLRRASIQPWFTSCLKGEQRQQVIDLVRSTLHSPAWYQQHIIAQELDPEATWSESAALSLKQLQATNEDMYVPRCEIDEATKRLAKTVERIQKYQALQPAYEADASDPEIYSQEPDDTKEVERMRADNEAKLAQLQAAIEAVKPTVKSILELRRDASFPQSIKSELDMMDKEFAAAFQEAEKSSSDGAKFLLTRRSRVADEFRMIRNEMGEFDRHLYRYEEGLECILERMWSLGHRIWPNILKEMKQIDAQQAAPVLAEQTL